MRDAAIDIGSNSVRLLIVEDGVALYKITETTRLAEGLIGSGRLALPAMKRTVKAVQVFADRARAEGAGVCVFATEAVRAGENGMEFTQLVKEATGLCVDVLNGESEAKAGYFGAAEGLPGVSAVLDIGGASTELSIGRNREVIYFKSVPIGVVRILERCNGDRRAAEEYAAEMIARYGELPAFDRFIGIGGSVTNLVAVLYRIIPYRSSEVHGKVIPLAQLKGLEDRLYGMTVAERIASGVHPKRADLICGGVTLLRSIVEYAKVHSLVASESDNLEGYLRMKKLNGEAEHER